MPDVGVADYQISRHRMIFIACEKWWPLVGPNQIANKSDCSGFVTSVANELGVTLVGNANSMYHQIQLSPWSILGFGDSAAHLAAVASTNGQFVVGAWLNPNAGGNGHVAVVVDTNYSSSVIAHRTRALAYWGTKGAVGDKRSVHSNSWGNDKRPNVVYAALNITA